MGPGQSLPGIPAVEGRVDATSFPWDHAIGRWIGGGRGRLEAVPHRNLFERADATTP